MKNNRDISGFIANILIVVAILALIVVGLNRIGIYDLPDSVEKLLGTSDEQDDPALSESFGTDIDKSLVYDENQGLVLTGSELTFENARSVLERLSSPDSYSQKLILNFTEGDRSDSQTVELTKSSGLYKASIFSSSGTLIKTVTEDKKGFTVKAKNAKGEESFTLPRAGFDISDECGFILDAKSFLESGFTLDEALFESSVGKYGSQITITFENAVGDYRQKQVYTISLDYGVVISALCYENDVIFYSMDTTLLER